MKATQLIESLDRLIATTLEEALFENPPAMESYALKHFRQAVGAALVQKGEKEARKEAYEEAVATHRQALRTLEFSTPESVEWLHSVQPGPEEVLSDTFSVYGDDWVEAVKRAVTESWVQGHPSWPDGDPDTYVAYMPGAEVLGELGEPTGRAGQVAILGPYDTRAAQMVMDRLDSGDTSLARGAKFKPVREAVREAQRMIAASAEAAKEALVEHIGSITKEGSRARQMIRLGQTMVSGLQTTSVGKGAMYTVPIDLSGWGYVESADVSITEAEKRVSKEISRRYWGDNKGGLPVRVYAGTEADSSGMAGNSEPAKAIWSKDGGFMEVYLGIESDSETPLTREISRAVKRSKRSLLHEMRHFSQSMLPYALYGDEAKGMGRFGLPPKKVRHSGDPGDKSREHGLRDVEFQTRLGDVVSDFEEFVAENPSVSPRKIFDHVTDQKTWRGPAWRLGDLNFTHLAWFSRMKRDDRRRWKAAVKALAKELGDRGITL